VHRALTLPDPSTANAARYRIVDRELRAPRGFVVPGDDAGFAERRKELAEALDEALESDTTPDRANALRLELAKLDYPELAGWLADAYVAGDLVDALANLDIDLAHALQLVHTPAAIASLAHFTTEAGDCFGCERHRSRAIALLEAAVADLRARPLGTHRADGCERHTVKRPRKAAR
jgi:hypothetical protein